MPSMISDEENNKNLEFLTQMYHLNNDIEELVGQIDDVVKSAGRNVVVEIPRSVLEALKVVLASQTLACRHLIEENSHFREGLAKLVNHVGLCSNCMGSMPCVECGKGV